MDALLSNQCPQIAETQLYFPTRLFHVCADGGKLTGNARIVTAELRFNSINGLDRSLNGRQNPSITLRKQFLYHTPVSFVPSPVVSGLFLACDRSQIVLADLKQGVLELFRSSARVASLTCVVFSPTRPSLFLPGKDNGEVEVWVVLDKSHECLFTQSVASFPSASALDTTRSSSWRSDAETDH
jgi:hypothetical protein